MLEILLESLDPIKTCVYAPRSDTNPEGDSMTDSEKEAEAGRLMFHTGQNLQNVATLLLRGPVTATRVSIARDRVANALQALITIEALLKS
jgi:hypothetical protein